VITDEGPGLNCPYSGQLVISGTDLDDSDTLEPSESTSRYVCNGAQGATPLITTDVILPSASPAPSNAECAISGGIVLTIGFDADASGTLTGQEIDEMEFICNGLPGADGEDGTDSLIEVFDLGTSVSDPCGLGGGIQIDVGQDADSSGDLNGSEVSQTRYVCNGLNTSHNILAETSEEAPGSNCANGGVKIQTGTDLNDSLTLEDGEISGNQYVCAGEQGDPGEQGPRGAQGQQGVQGAEGVQGLQGVEGEQGADGPEGDVGPAGPGGHNAALRKTILEVGSTECPTGGAIIETGVDDNGNGLLNDNEVDDSQTICNGDDGEEQVFAFEPIEKGGECGDETTGVSIRSGLDDGNGNGIAGDGILQSGEIDNERALCVEGANVTASDTSGCSAGGTGTSSGNHNNALWLLAVGALLLLRRRRSSR
jgi:MYXO-CTERM domain-containing protein